MLVKKFVKGAGD